MISCDQGGQVVGKGDIREQTRQCLCNIAGIIEGGGGSLNDLVKMTVFITNLEDYDGMNEIRQEVLIEIEEVASVDG